jgi:hypothetical protein
MRSFGLHSGALMTPMCRSTLQILGGRFLKLAGADVVQDRQAADAPEYSLAGAAFGSDKPSSRNHPTHSPP